MSHADTLSMNDRRFMKPADTISNHTTEHQSHHLPYRPANNLHKSNTLTPADVKKLKEIRNFRSRFPARTASVLHKPRAPQPILNSSDDFQKSISLPVQQRSSSIMPLNKTTNNRPETASQMLVESVNNKARAFLNPIANLKRFLRYVPIGRANGNNNDSSASTNNSEQTKFSLSADLTSNVWFDIRESQLSFPGPLDRSESPPAYPPPPNELKSFNYILNANRYSNYDEFTRTRNKLSTTLLNHSHSQRIYDSVIPRDTTMMTPTNDTNFHSSNHTQTQTQINQQTNNITQRMLSSNDGLPPRMPHSCDHAKRIPHPSDNTPPANMMSNGIVRSNSQRASISGDLIHDMQTKQKQHQQGDVLDGESFDNPADTTLIPDSLALESVETTCLHQNKNNNNVLENIIVGLQDEMKRLKGDLQTKDKALTAMQLNQWKSDCTVYELRASICALEKENANLKLMIVKINERVKHDDQRAFHEIVNASAV